MTWSVGYSGPIKITTRLEDEREIDIDDRSANLIVDLEMLETVPFALEAQNVVVTLNFDFSAPTQPTPAPVPPIALGPDPAISFGGVEKGPYELIKASDNVTLRPGTTVQRAVTVRTGAFARTPVSRDTPSAKPGRKEVDAHIEFDLAPFKPAGAELIERDVTMQLVVAED